MKYGMKLHNLHKPSIMNKHNEIIKFKKVFIINSKSTALSALTSYTCLKVFDVGKKLMCFLHYHSMLHYIHNQRFLSKEKGKKKDKGV